MTSLCIYVCTDLVSADTGHTYTHKHRHTHTGAVSLSHFFSHAVCRCDASQMSRHLINETKTGNLNATFCLLSLHPPLLLVHVISISDLDKVFSDKYSLLAWPSFSFCLDFVVFLFPLLHYAISLSMATFVICYCLFVCCCARFYWFFLILELRISNQLMQS